MSEIREQPTGVVIDASTLRWVSAAYPACFLTLSPGGIFDPDTMIAQTTRAIATLQGDSHKQGNVTDAVRVFAVVEGTDSLHLRISGDAATRTKVLAWVTALAQALTDAGLHGTLRRPVPQYADKWVTTSALNDGAVSALCATRAPVDANLVERLSDAYGLDQFPHHVLFGGSDFSLAVRHRAQLLSAIPELQRGVVLSGWGEAPPDHAAIFFSSRISKSWTPQGDRRAQAERAQAALIKVAPDVHHAFAEVTEGAGGWGISLHSPPDGIKSSAYLALREQWPHRVFDAHGLQILTADHLERAHDLTDWHTRQVGDRYLVAARDLDPWLTNDHPDPTVLDRARTDFGDMIIAKHEYTALRKAERRN